MIWAQNPKNMGSWHFMERMCRSELGLEIKVMAREKSASPATGSLTLHQHEAADLARTVTDGL